MELFIVFLGAFGSLASILGVYYIFRRVDRPRLAIVQYFNAKLFNRDITDNSRVRVSFDYQDINEPVFLIRYAIINGGQADILRDNVVSPLTIKRTDNFRWIDVTILTNSKRLDIQAEVENGNVLIKHQLFKEGEGCTIELIGLGDPKNIFDIPIEHRIVDVKKIDKYEEADNVNISKIIRMILLIISILFLANSVGVNKVYYEDIVGKNFMLSNSEIQTDSIKEVNEQFEKLKYELNELGMTSVGYYIDTTFSLYSDNMTVGQIRQQQDSLTKAIEKSYPGYSIGQLFYRIDTLKQLKNDLFIKYVIDRPNKDELELTEYHQLISVSEDYSYWDLYRLKVTKRYPISSTALVNFELVNYNKIFLLVLFTTVCIVLAWRIVYAIFKLFVDRDLWRTFDKLKL